MWLIRANQILDIFFQYNHLLLESKDGRDAAIDRVREPSLSLIWDRNHRVMTTVHRNMMQQFRHVAGPKNLMDRREPSGSLVRPEMWSENASTHTLPSQELASPTRRGRSCPRRRSRCHNSSAGRKWWRRSLLWGSFSGCWFPARIWGVVASLLISHHQTNIN